jgi:hypothetical protein
MPDMYKDKYLKKKPNSGHGYMHIRVPSRFISGILLYVWARLLNTQYGWTCSKKMELVQFPSFINSTLYAETEIFNIQIECRKRSVA